MGHDLAAKQQQQRPKQRERNFFLKKPINIGEYRKRGKWENPIPTPSRIFKKNLT